MMALQTQIDRPLSDDEVINTDRPLSEDGVTNTDCPLSDDEVINADRQSVLLSLLRLIRSTLQMKCHSVCLEGK